MDFEEELTVWCGNLPSQIEEDILYELFLQVAPLKKVKIPTDKSGKCLNYGFVIFKHQASVQYAIDMFNNIQLFDRSIIVRSRHANNSNNKNQNQMLLPQPIIPNGLLMGMGFGLGGMLPFPILQSTTMLSMIAPEQHDFYGKGRGRHGQHQSDKPYWHRNNQHQRNNRNHYDDRHRRYRH